MKNLKNNLDNIISQKIQTKKTLSINLEKLGHEFQISLVSVDSENALILDWINYSSKLGTNIAFQLNIVNKYGSSEEERNEKNMLLDRVFDLYSTGKKVPEIAVIVGKSERTVYRYLKEQKLKSAKNFGKIIKPNEDYDQNEPNLYS